MNILVDQLPGWVSIDGKQYKLATDFHIGLRIILAFEDEDLTTFEKQSILLTLLYPVIPENVEEAVKQGVKFLNGGEEPKESEEVGLRLYSFTKDANFVFAAFRQTHNIDLEEVNMHWWKFLALFMDMGSETTFCQLVSLRKRVKSGEATKEERKLAREMEDIFDIPEPDNMSLEERELEQAFLQSLEKHNHGG